MSDTADDTPTNVEPCANYRPGQRFRPRKSVPHTIDGIASMLRSVVRRDDFDVPDLASLKRLNGALRQATDDAVRNLRAQGVTWQAIADELGTSKANVVQRWAKLDELQASA